MHDFNFRGGNDRRVDVPLVLTRAAEPAKVAFACATQRAFRRMPVGCHPGRKSM